MAKPVKVTVAYIDGTKEKFYGGLHFSEKHPVLCIWPEKTSSQVKIPLASIKKITIKDQEG